jgi:hypothetical protein
LNNENVFPAIVISVDFEMRWGVHDIYGLDIDSYRENLENVKEVVPRMLSMFSERNLRVTWATVGALALESWDEYFSVVTDVPKYEDQSLAVDSRYAEMDPDGNLYFANNLVYNIILTPGQEMGSHSFSHLYFREKGVTADDFIKDSVLVKKIMDEKFDINPISYVFPKNQSAFLSELEDNGFIIWRDNENPWYYDANTNRTNTLTARSLRLFEGVSPWLRRSQPLEPGKVRSTMFIRFNLPDFLWKLHIHRIKHEILNLSNNDVFHIWWHPHNLGYDLQKRLHRLENVLDIIANSCAFSGIQSCNMSDVAI